MQEKLCGELLMIYLPTLDATTRASLACEMRDILRQLTKPTKLMPWAILGSLQKDFLRWLPYQLKVVHNMLKPHPLETFDLSCPLIFSHGDLVSENILVPDAHVSGIVGRASTAWYPYFWNDYIARWRTHLPQFRDGKWAGMFGGMMESFRKEVAVYNVADRFL
ncbi:hypothetical protein DFH08DRAFT_1071477 [Mycena albidolilacea]|uniref:Aminoglycoside phosphotransferase domain-containing protein n=1 Tax=Mycena albidolilacea TaxID=1033008 RepID=A0AAD7AW13_9AGAR|nr:hypothetical protein DFH08DRAFT_1071477 [Mycena albidolilacea]